MIAKPDGTIVVSEFVDASRAPEVWREVRPYQWVDRTGGRLVAVVKDGKVVNLMSDELPPVLELLPVPGWAKASWNLPLLWFTLAVLLGAIMLWPLQIFVRWRYGKAFPLNGRRATTYRLARIGAIVQVAGFAAYLVMFQALLGGSLNADPSLTPLLVLCKALCALGLIGTLVEAWNTLTVWTTPPSSWWAKTSSVLIVVAGLGFAWFVLALHLASPSLHY